MPLVEHLRELRNRLAKSVAVIIVVMITAAFYSEQLMQFLAEPVPKCEDLANSDGGNCAIVSFNTLTSPFTTTIKVSLMAGLVVSSPVWLYQLWAFVAPGLHKQEKKYTYFFVSVAVPLFAGGAYLAYVILPISVKVLLSLTPGGSANILSLDEVLDFTIRMVLIFGLAFELPLLLIMLNMGGIVSGRRMIGWWRGVVMGVFVFGAVATPTTDPVGMIALSGPIILLYFAAVAFSLVNDKRRARKESAGLADDEASELDLTAEAVDPVEPVAAVPEQVTRGRVNGYDDVT
ncbi:MULTISPECIES: twin-arginine translocase subunit TatC [Streptomyces]|uniref:Sec-independent protein translocase protein TatC n=1 Tax=Streptomyces prasinus TaxID=67345 RepID=A0ABX6B7Q6_9ACTN|nr:MULTISPECIES: twin-arginine translocase subunit TatC [Streptomyces]MCP3770534.1 twin-arginine translocase subunit TatC [Streptomyces sp. MAR25Y5]OBQ47400.1 twin arginine-targeting protein translocase TatC [Streptomyces sp. H-KF8]QEV10104.1 twin-arginine translocase subunit TatC [Streptomyces prasinus]